MYSEILLKVKTEEEREALIEEIRGLKASLYEHGSFFEDTLRTRVRDWVSQVIKDAVAQRDAVAQKEIDKEKYLQGLIEELSKLKSAKLVLAFEPTEAAVQRYHEFISKEVGEGVVLNISCLPGILGGAIIIFEGKYRDFSLRRVFEEEFRQSRELILKTLSLNA